MTQPAAEPTGLSRGQRTGRLVLRLLFSAGVLTLLFVILPWDQVAGAASRMTLTLYLGALAGFIAGHALGALKWRLMLASSVGGARLSARDTAGCYGAGLFSNLFLPTVVGGDIVRATLAARALGRAEAVVLGSVADRLIDFAGLGLLIAGGVIVAGAELSGWAGPLTAVVGIALIGAGALLLPLALRRPLARWPARVRRRVGRSLVALRRLARQPRTALIALLLSLSMQSVFILISAWLGHAVGAHAPLWAWFVAWPLAKAAGMLPVSLGGLGVRDAALAGLLVPLGVPAAFGLVASLAWNAVLIGGALLGGVLWLLLRPGRHNRASQAAGTAGSRALRTSTIGRNV
jgi:glycosyltransferase 2 family protein